MSWTGRGRGRASDRRKGLAMTAMHAMLGNAAVAAVLALVALAIGCACRSPAVRHAAWILVLLKLVTPPLFSVPLRVLPASWGTPPAKPAPSPDCGLSIGDCVF